MSELPLLDGVKNYVQKHMISFTMPGHKGGIGFSNLEYNITKEFDITEVDGVDNLHNAEGIIKDAEDLLKSYYGARKAYFLVNGTSSGNLIMLHSCFNEGDKVIVDRFCHKSILNGLILKKLKPVYIKNKIHKDYNIPISIDKESFYKAVKENPDAKGIIITYPNYFGICCDLQYIMSIAKRYKMKVIVDSAHGAHFGTSSKLPFAASVYKPSMVTLSAHKSLPALNQGSYLLVFDEDKEILSKADFYFQAFTTTSPSYPIMCSLDYARSFLSSSSKAYDELIINIKECIEKINELKLFHVFCEDDLKDDENIKLDITKLNIIVPEGCSGAKLYDYLLTKNIQCEMSFTCGVNLICTPFNSKENFESLCAALSDCKREYIMSEEKIYKDFQIEIPEKVFYPYETFNFKKKEIEILKAEGMVCACTVTPYPPGIPMLMPGETVSSKHIELLDYYFRNNLKVIGLKKHKIIVTNNGH